MQNIIEIQVECIEDEIYGLVYVATNDTLEIKPMETPSRVCSITWARRWRNASIIQTSLLNTISHPIRV